MPNLEPIAKTLPTVDDATARTIAANSVRTAEAVPAAAVVVASASKLVVHVANDLSRARLARRSEVTIGNPAVSFSQVVVDALTASVLERWKTVEKLTQERVPAAGFDSKTEQFPVIVDGTVFLGWRVATAQRGDILVFQETEGSLVHADALVGPWDTQAVSALANVERGEDFFASRFGWKGKKGSDGQLLTLALTVRLPGELNAFGGADNGGTRMIMQFTAGQAEAKPFVTHLAVVGHEYTHIINQLSNGLGQDGEPHSISEGIADVFGLSFQNAVNGGAVYALPEVGRDAVHPTAHPNQQDNCRNKAGAGDDYANATIVSHSWVLMTQGGTNDTSKRTVAEPLGNSPSQRLWWATLRRIIGPTTKIEDLARAQVAYAVKTRGIAAKPVACAWLAVDALTEWVKDRKIACPATADAGVTDGGPVTDRDSSGIDPNVDGGYGGCTHDVCAFGEPLGPQCTPCTQKVCDVDKYCCTTHWGPSCWYALEAQCGIKCQ